MNKKISLLFLFLLGIFRSVSAQTDPIPEVPNPSRLVNDYAGILSQDQKLALERKLVAFDDSTGTQIAIVVVKSIGEYDKASFTTTLAKRWKVGRDKNNGVVILVKPKSGNEKGNAYIAVGKGLEGVIPDITAKRIFEKEMIPHFKNNQYFEGIDAAANTIISLANGEFKAQDYEKKSQKGISTSLLIVIIFAIILLASLFRKKNSNATYGGSDLPFWLAMMMSSGGRSGNYGDFRSGGGDFGGFGGGDFGGGGAGGDW